MTKQEYDELLKAHPCSICGRLGHWHRECSQNPASRSNMVAELSQRTSYNQRAIADVFVNLQIPQLMPMTHVFVANSYESVMVIETACQKHVLELHGSLNINKL